jgi:hypothetical protein
MNFDQKTTEQKEINSTVSRQGLGSKSVNDSVKRSRNKDKSSKKRKGERKKKHYKKRDTLKQRQERAKKEGKSPKHSTNLGKIKIDRSPNNTNARDVYMNGVEEDNKVQEILSKRDNVDDTYYNLDYNVKIVKFYNDGTSASEIAKYMRGEPCMSDSLYSIISKKLGNYVYYPWPDGIMTNAEPEARKYFKGIFDDIFKSCTSTTLASICYISSYSYQVIAKSISTLVETHGDFTFNLNTFCGYIKVLNTFIALDVSMTYPEDEDDQPSEMLKDLCMI